MHIVGAGCHMAKPNSSETGLLLEFLLENKHRNPYHAFPVWDTVLWEKIKYQANLDSFLNTVVSSVKTEGNQIKSLFCYQQTTETAIEVRPHIVIDATGHGTIGVLAGAEYRIGSESKYEFNEPTAPEEANNYTMGNSILFQAVDRGKPVKFEKPFWAYCFTEEDLKYRHHYNLVASMADGGNFEEFHEGAHRNLPEFSRMDAGYWWIELGGNSRDIITESEDIRDELLKSVYGIWDHIKNCGDHGASNYDLEWVGIVPGYRESRRLVGDYLLNENDIRANRVFPDAVAYGGWPMDNHVPGGLRDFDRNPTIVYNFEGLFTIPYRCFYSKNIDNLMMAGRDISTTKMAFSSTRVMGTCAVGGQASGTAAALAIRYNCSPRELSTRIDELQQLLLRNDCYIPGFAGKDPDNLAQGASIQADSFIPGCEPHKIINGVTRPVEEEQNCWESNSLGKDGQCLYIDLKQSSLIREIRLVFDSNLTREIMPSITAQVKERQTEGMPEELVKDYNIELYNHGEKVFSQSIMENYQRLNIITLKSPVQADQFCIRVLSTHGRLGARIFEIRLY